MNLKTYFQNNSQVEFARKLGVTPGAVNQWANGLSAVSAERCPQIEKATGGLVRCEDLRPDVAWSVLRGKPELPPTDELKNAHVTPAVAIESATDKQVTRKDLLPDDWHLIWPELIGTDGSPAISVPATEGGLPCLI